VGGSVSEFVCGREGSGGGGGWGGNACFYGWVVAEYLIFLLDC